MPRLRHPLSVSPLFLLPRRVLFAFGFGLFAPLLAAAPVITEVMASNATTRADEDGDYSDWLEIHNPDAQPVSLAGWHLTDNEDQPTKWTFPAGVTVPGNGYLIVWASNKDRGSATTPLHTNFALSSGGEYLGLIEPDGETVASDFDPEYPALSDDTSYGVTQPLDGTTEPEWGFFATPTPGQRNGGPDALVRLGGVAVSPDPRTFTGTLTVSLTGAADGQVIRYSLTPPNEDGAAAPPPDEDSPLYTQPLQLTESVVLRAAVFVADSGLRGPVATAHFPRVEATAATVSAGMPVLLLDNHGFGPMVKDDIDRDGWLHVFTPGADGRADLTQSPELVTPVEFKVRGSSSADFPKKGFNVELKRTTGGDNPLPLLGMPASEDWAVVAPWFYDRSYLRNSFAYELGRRLGYWAPRTRLAELWLNANGGPVDASDYHGLVVVSDRIRFGPDRVAIDEVEGDATAQPEITGGYILKIDGPDPDEYAFRTERGLPWHPTTQVVVYRPKAEDLPEEQRLYLRNYIQEFEDALYADRAANFATRNYLDYVDLPSWVDFHLLNLYLGNADALWRSVYFYKERERPLVAGPLWDFDRSGGSAEARTERWDQWTLPGFGEESGSGGFDIWGHEWWGQLARDPEFMQAWIDRWQALRRRVLSDDAIALLVADLAAEVDPAAAARDAARWPDNASRFPGGFQGEVDHLRDWMQRRAEWIDDQFVAAPSVTYANEAFVLTPAPGAELIYTLDGSDPRATGGAPAEGAITSAGPVTVEAQHNFRARSYLAARADAFPGSPWSAPLTASELPGSARIINVSTRAFAGSGEAVLIAGFYVAGSEPRRFLVRAVGPALANFGIGAPLADPRLRVVAADGTEVGRDRYWWSGTNAAGLAEIMHDAGAFALADESNDAATVVELAPGAYTVVVDDLQNREGIALAEVYALEAEHARTINVSSRAFVHPQAEQTLMAGLLVRGDTPKRLLVRGVGPSLAQYGVNEPLADPVLTIWREGVAVASNDDWNATPELLAATADAGAFALDAESRDAALIVVLPPGDYTAHVTGKGEDPGIALVEMYEIP